MSDVFCYFLGAGASCNALPLVKDIPDRLKSFIERLDNYKSETDTTELRNSLNALLEQVQRHATIDTYAKKLFIRNAREDLKKLKAVTSCFFVYEQSQKQADYRYDTFLASVVNFNDLRGTVEIPDNIRVLSWNYDTQIEKAFYNFCDDHERVGKHITFNTKQVERLNGYCSTHPPGNLRSAYRAALGDSPHEGLNAAVDLYSEYMREFNSVPADINFAWETEQEHRRKRIMDSFLPDVTILIVIGYSFPFFNRQVDREILNSLKKVKRIYVQVPESAHDSVRERMLALKSDLPEMKFLKDTSEFHIPFEYP
jgi:hypothetical protein